jgi:putative transposase
VAADFLVAITAGFRVLYVLVVMEVGSRRILHCNVTAHPTGRSTSLTHLLGCGGVRGGEVIIPDNDKHEMGRFYDARMM